MSTHVCYANKGEESAMSWLVGFGRQPRQLIGAFGVQVFQVCGVFWFVFLQNRAAAVVFKLGLRNGPHSGSALAERWVSNNSPHKVPRHVLFLMSGLLLWSLVVSVAPSSRSVVSLCVFHLIDSSNSTFLEIRTLCHLLVLNPMGFLTELCKEYVMN